MYTLIVDADTVTPELRQLIDELNSAWKKVIKPNYIKLKKPTAIYYIQPNPNVRNDN